DGDFAMNLIQELEKEQFDKLSAGKTIPEFGPGDTVIVNVKVVEGDGSRVPRDIADDRLDHRGAPRQGAPRQAVLPAQSARQVGPYRRKEVGPRRRRRRVVSRFSFGEKRRAHLLRFFAARSSAVAVAANAYRA